MARYIGIGPERGTVIEGEEDATLIALTACGVMPIGEMEECDEAFLQAVREWYYSGNWIVEEDRDGLC